MATLKISDLSVGDWVEYEGLHYPITFVGYGEGGDGSLVNLIRPDLSCFTCKISDIHPIPITAEMLEKNGFVRLLERDLFYHSKAGLEVAFEDGEWMHTINLHEYTIHTISGVHHIQHLLRLYGCEKEINL